MSKKIKVRNYGLDFIRTDIYNTQGILYALGIFIIFVRRILDKYHALIERKRM